MKPEGKPIPDAPGLSGGTVVVGLSYVPGRLEIRLEDGTGATVVVTFDDVVGFRVLDERDLLHYWPEFSTPAGWAFEITGGGWHAHESLRKGSYLVPEVQPNAREFFITGEDECVNVIAMDAPRIEIKKAEPVRAG